MKMMLNLVKGLESIHPQYGKFLGKNKDGIKLYEQLFGNQRVLTSLNKDGGVYKQISRTKNGELVTTQARNFVNGDTVTVEKSDLTFGFTKQDGKTGSWEELNAMYRGNKPTGDIRDIQFEYINCDIPGSKVLTMNKSNGAYYNEINLNAAKTDKLTGEVKDYNLPNGSVIPKGEHCVCGIDTTQPRVSGSEKDSNLGDVLARNITEFAKRICGIKP